MEPLLVQRGSGAILAQTRARALMQIKLAGTTRAAPFGSSQGTAKPLAFSCPCG
jgi:hypothetical protein